MHAAFPIRMLSYMFIWAHVTKHGNPENVLQCSDFLSFCEEKVKFDVYF